MPVFWQCFLARVRRMVPAINRPELDFPANMLLRGLLKIFLLFILLVGMAAGIWLVRSADPRYDATELICRERYHRYDDLITTIARERELDPMLVKALIWRESRFHPGKRGTSGEGGLMQVGPAAASEWAKAERPAGITPADLLDPKTNIEAGTWILARGLKRWQPATDDPVPFALAEYNAGASRVRRWVGETGDKERSAAAGSAVQYKGADLASQIKIASTRQYVETVQNRWRFYQKRGRF